MPSRLSFLLAFALLAAGLAACDGAEPATDPAAPPADDASAADGSTEAADVPDETDDESGADDAAPDADAGAETDDNTFSDMVASVNGRALSMAEFQRMAFDTQRYFVDRGGVDPNTEEGQRELLALRRQVLLDMINQALADEAAEELGFTVSDDEMAEHMARFEEQLGGQAAFEEQLAAADTTREDWVEMERQMLIGQQFIAHVARDVPETARFASARHVLCETREDCQAALERLEAGEDFAALARELSTDELSAENGGDLGWIPLVDDHVYLPSAEMDEMIRWLEPGERSEVFESDFGFHVLEVVEIDEERELDEQLRNRLSESAVQDWLARRRAEADIVVFLEDLEDVAASSSP